MSQIEDELKEIVSDMHPLLERAGLTKGDILAVTDYRVDHQMAYPVVCDVARTQFTEYRRVRELATEDTWAYYEATGTTGLAEQKLLSAAAKALRHAWRSKVLPFAKRNGK